MIISLLGNFKQAAN